MSAHLVVRQLALALLLAGCTTSVTGGGSSVASTISGTTAAAAGSGITAEPSSSALAVRGANLRLIRVSTTELALQFEFANGTDQPLSPDTLGIDEIERALLLADLARGTAYEVLTQQGLQGRISESNDAEVPPGGTVTVTTMFSAPPEETTKLTVLIDGLLPVEVPVQLVGAPGLVDDPVLRASGASEPLISPLLCTTSGPAGSGGQKTVQIRLPSDVLFEFAKADLTPAAQGAIAAVDDEIGAGRGTVTIEGHTDAFGDDASNQTLSERRAEAVRGALEAVLGGSFSYRAVGFGETRPVAPNTRPDGSDDPDGRALNRRVVIRTGDVEPVATATLEALPVTTDLATAGLRAEVRPLQRQAGYLLAQLVVSNPTSEAIDLGPGSGLTPDQSEPIGLTLADRSTQRRHGLCRVPTRGYRFFQLANPSSEYATSGSGSVPPGATVTFWGFFAPPAADVTSVDVEVGGFGMTEPTPVPA